MRLEEMIFLNYNKLNNTDLLIWKYITANKKHCSKMSINELAMKCNVSRATITRFVKKLDLKGFSEFKVLLSWESEKVHVIENQSFDIACNSIIKYVEDQKIKIMMHCVNFFMNQEQYTLMVQVIFKMWLQNR